LEDLDYVERENIEKYNPFMNFTHISFEERSNRQDHTKSWVEVKQEIIWEDLVESMK
jgi:hypothetical protein